MRNTISNTISLKKICFSLFVFFGSLKWYLQSSFWENVSTGLKSLELYLMDKSKLNNHFHNCICSWFKVLSITNCCRLAWLMIMVLQ